MNILGISCYYHDAAAALVQDGRVVAAAEEERFTRKKHDSRFPESAIDFCLNSAGLEIEDIDQVCFYEKPLRKVERVLSVGKQYESVNGLLVKKQLGLALNEQLFLDRVLEQKFDYQGPLLFSDHHLSHAASTFYLSPYETAAILTVDGVGEWATTSEAMGDGKHITPIREIRYPHSLGLLYTTITAFLGFKANNDEYKVMGLASYGQPKYTDRIRCLLTQQYDSSFRLDMRYFSFPHDIKRMYSDAFIELFGPPRATGESLSQYHMDIAASLQSVTEEVMIALGRTLHEKTGTENLCLAGGVALNSVANWRVLQETPFKNLWIQPAAGDSGAAIGAALVAYYAQGDSRRIAPQRHSTLLGPGYSSDEVKAMLDQRGAMYTEYKESELFSKVAQLIHRNRIIGWFQGRMEFGPRALGNRSILANPCNPEMKDILNSRVKFREDFRPFAPAVLSERASDYFQCNHDSPYMLYVVPVVDGQAVQIPSVTHVDNTARLQTVFREENPRFYRLIEAFAELSGVPMVINTSFNIRGEPIVCTPDDAYDCFMKTDIDYLVVDRFLVEKEM